MGMENRQFEETFLIQTGFMCVLSQIIQAALTSREHVQAIPRFCFLVIWRGDIFIQVGDRAN